MGEPDFTDVVDEWMQQIDAHFIDAGIPISERIFEAARLFAETAVIEIKGDTKEDMLVKPWFKEIYSAVNTWYQQKYGEAILSTTKDFLIGACMYGGVAFELRVPRILRKVEKEGESAWLIYPRELQDGEDPMSWLTKPPNLDAMQAPEKQQLCDELLEVGTLLRSIYLDLASADRPDPVAVGKADSVLIHLQRAAERIFDPQQANLSLACWDAHQGLEQTLKLLSRQKTGKHKHTHEIRTLCKNISSRCKLSLNPNHLSEIPRQTEIIKMRAGEGPPVPISRAFQIYYASVCLTAQCAATLERQVSFSNARFLLRKAPWID